MINFIDNKCDSCSMAEASIAVYGAVIGVAIALAVTAFVLRGKGHHEPIEEDETNSSEKTDIPIN